MDNPCDLERFVTAQRNVYPDVLAELRAGRKRTHWMWFVFPQLAGLGTSPTAVRYAIKSRTEAEAYLAHPILGARLRECTAILNGYQGISAREILGEIDAMKFRSSLTLFASVDPERGVFRSALERFFGGQPDPVTLRFFSEND